MFGIEKIISKPLLNWIEGGGIALIGGRVKIVIGSYFCFHLISVILMSWMLYRQLKKKKNEKGWILSILSIVSLVISLIVPCKTGSELVDGIGCGVSKLFSWTTFLCSAYSFIGLIMIVTNLILYFYLRQKEAKKVAQK